MKSLSQLEEDLRRQAEDALDIVNRKEILVWQNHPCTTYLLRMLEADYLSYHMGWENGNFTTESDSGTIQANAKALGAVEALSLVSSAFDTIDNIKIELVEEEED